MKKIDEQVVEVISNQHVKDAKKLKHQQAYYNRLKKLGVTKQQTYNLKSLSAI